MSRRDIHRGLRSALLGLAAIVIVLGHASGDSTPTVTAVAPNIGPSAGGQVVTITGTNFSAPAQVNFGSASATNVSVQGSTSITAVTPANTAGTVDVSVITGGQTATL